MPTSSTMTQEERDWLEARDAFNTKRRHALRGLTPGREDLTLEQERSVDALVSRYGDAMIRSRTEGIVGVFHTEHPMEIAWLVNAGGDVAEYVRDGAPTYRYSATEVAAW